MSAEIFFITSTPGDVEPDPDRLHDLEGVHVAEVVDKLGPETPGSVYLALGPQAPVVGHQLGPGGQCYKTFCPFLSLWKCKLHSWSLASLFIHISR
jgi:hypothetical protein